MIEYGNDVIGILLSFFNASELVEQFENEIALCLVDGGTLNDSDCQFE